MINPGKHSFLREKTLCIYDRTEKDKGEQWRKPSPITTQPPLIIDNPTP